MEFWTSENLKTAMGGTWVARPEGAVLPIEGVSIDSRTIRPGQAFFAIRGERTDGHLYVREAIAAGASLVILERPEAAAELGSRPACVLRVPDVGGALLKLAGVYRRTLDTTKVIAVGGSNGKTTTVKLLHQVLSGSLRGTASPKSFNNAIGVPLTILGARRSDQYLVCEIGTNAPGEIAPLARAAEPDIAVITSIGREHLEGLGSLEGVVAEETSLLSGLRAGGLAVLNADAPGLVEQARPLLTAGNRQLLTFGQNEASDLRLTGIEPSPQGLRFCLNARTWYSLPLLGSHNAWNAAAVVAVARRLGVDAGEIERALAAAQGAPMRLERTSAGGIQFINDAYNANPESVLAALTTFGESFSGCSGRRVLVLGDMLELGEAAPELHREVGDAVAGCGWADLVIFVGSLSLFTADRAGRKLAPEKIAIFPDLGEGRAAELARLLRPGDAVLLKGSRRMALERLIDAVREQSGPMNEIKNPAPAKAQ